jgi:hypothetical protein
MQQVSKVILFFTRSKICRTSVASVQICRVKKRFFTNELHTNFFLAPVSLDNIFFDTQNLKIFSCVNPWTFKRPVLLAF